MQIKKDKLTSVIRKKLIEGKDIKQSSIKVINVSDVQKGGMEKLFKGLLKANSPEIKN